MAASTPAASAREGTLRFLTFWMSKRLYALPADQVAEVIRAPVVARMPQSPKSLLGLANLRGTVIPVASLRGLLGQDPASGDEARSIVLDGAAPIALSVDAVDALVSIGVDELHANDAAIAAESGEVLRGAFQSAGSDTVAKVLDIHAMLAAALVQPARAERRANRVSDVARVSVAEQRAQTRKLITFDIAGQEFALGLDEVREIISAPKSVSAIPRSEALVLGVTSYRDRLLPLLSLRALLGFAPEGADENGAVVVAMVGGALVGLAVDGMRAIISAEEHLIQTPPTVLMARAGGEAQIKAIYRGEGGARLISLLAPESLFKDDVMRRLGTSGYDVPVEPTAPVREESLTFLVFQLGEDEFALPIDAVVEVARVPEQITRLPKTPAFLEGVVNLRGEVIPVIDQRRRFDMAPIETQSGRRVIVVRSERHRAGVIVDAVSDVLRTSASAIGPAPAMAGDATRLVSGVVNLEETGRLVMILDPDELLSRTERTLLDAFAADETPDAP